jgi:hypothetical protein
MSLKAASARTRIVNVGKAASIVAAATMAVAACGGESDDTSAPAAASAAETLAADGSAPVADGESPYVDGQYSAIGDYQSPGGKQEIGVTVTLSNSVITALTLDTSNTTGPSAEFQGKFSSGIDDLVVGKSIDELSVSKVSGSSLTSIGFNDAIDQIKTEAAA